jgi:hypothetical protein
METIQSVLDLCGFSNSVETRGKMQETHTKRDTSVIKVQATVLYGWNVDQLGERRTRGFWFF